MPETVLTKPDSLAPRTTAADRIAAALARNGVEVMFSQSLPSRLILACQDAGIRQITYRTENAGGAMADGYARRSNKVGIVCAQNGPAATLLVPPLAECLKSSIPVVALVQDVNRSQIDRNAFQELDHLALFDSSAKWVRRVWDADRAEEYAEMALVAAASGRPGPAVLLLPADLLNETLTDTENKRTGKIATWPLDRVTADPAAVGRAADLLAEAEAPLVVAGGGVHGAQAAGELATLQEAAALPIATTTMGKGVIDERHPLSVGLVGNVMGTRSLGKHTKPIIDDADVILLVGTRTNQNGTDSWTLLPRTAQTIHLDIDGQEVGRNYDSLRLVGDAKLTLQALTEALSKRDLRKRQSDRSEVERFLADARAKHAADTEDVRRSDARPIRPERVMEEIQRVLTPETTVVADASYSSVWITSYLTSLRSGMRFLTPRGLAGLGWGFPMAMGAALARRTAPTVCVAGDGGFGHVWSEIETAVREEIPVILIVLNNGVLGYQKDAETVKFGRYTDACHFGKVDHAAIARACGCAAERIEDPADIGPALTNALARPGPTLLDIVTAPGAFPPLTMFDGSLPDSARP